MVVAIPTEGYCQASDVSVLTGREYTADSTPNLLDIELSIKNATGLINSRLLALGVSLAGVGENSQLLDYLKMVAARWAAGEASYGLGDTRRGNEFNEAALDLLDRLDAGAQDEPFGTQTAPTQTAQGTIYGAFPGTGEIAGEAPAVQPSEDFARYTLLTPDLTVLDNNVRINVLRIDDDRPLKRGDLLTAHGVLHVSKLPQDAIFNIPFNPELVFVTGQQEIILKNFPRPVNASIRADVPVEMQGRYVADQDLADWHVVMRVTVPQSRTSQDIDVLGAAGAQPRTYLQVNVIGASD